MKRSVSDEKDTHLTCTDKHASQMKHSLCYWLLFLEKIIFHLTCKQACGHFSAYLHLFVCICNVQKTCKNNENTTDLLEKTKQCRGRCKKAADPPYWQRMHRKNAETLGQTPSAEPGVHLHKYTVFL